jgi:signal transduction histidine kinase
MRRRVIFISALVVAITFAYYYTFFQYVYYPSYVYYHTLFRDLYFLPLILGGLWFGLKGSLATSLGITILSLPFMALNWGRMSPDDFNRVLELIVFNTVGVVFGYVSDRETAREKALHEAESLASMGRALSVIAHDMANPLTAMGGFARLLEEKPWTDEDSRRKLAFIIKGAERLEDMIRDMLDFSRPLELRPTKEDMNRVVRETAAVLDYKAQAKRVPVRLELSPDLPPFDFDCPLMERVFLNLVSNAIDASPEGDSVMVRTAVKGGRALFEVADRGPGIPQEQRKKIFVPFFTTKRHGTGLGLAIVLKIVEAHGGEVKVLKSPERGATFRVSLPLSR